MQMDSNQAFATARATSDDHVRDNVRAWLTETFNAVFLLTSDVERAESVALGALASVPLGEITVEALHLAAARIALSGPVPESAPTLAVGLPEELERVRVLPLKPRQCFVLTILMGLGPARCAELLHLPLHETCAHLLAALTELEKAEER
jgi:hypothetical protein